MCPYRELIQIYESKNTSEYFYIVSEVLVMWEDVMLHVLGALVPLELIHALQK